MATPGNNGGCCVPSGATFASRPTAPRAVGAPTPDPGVEGAGTSIWYDLANDCEPVILVTTVDDAGVPTSTFYDQGGNPLSNSPNYSPNKPNKNAETTEVYATNVDSASPDYGQIIPLKQFTPTVDGVPDLANITYLDISQAPAVDVTAAVTVAPYQIDFNSIYVQYGIQTETLDVTGATPPTLTIPTHAAYAEVYIDASADDAGIRWVKDGSIPTDDKGEQELQGGTIKLYGPELAGFRPLGIDSDGVLDPAVTASLTITYGNRDPNEE